MQHADGRRRTRSFAREHRLRQPAGRSDRSAPSRRTAPSSRTTTPTAVGSTAIRIGSTRASSPWSEAEGTTCSGQQFLATGVPSWSTRRRRDPRCAAVPDVEYHGYIAGVAITRRRQGPEARAVLEMGRTCWRHGPTPRTSCTPRPRSSSTRTSAIGPNAQASDCGAEGRGDYRCRAYLPTDVIALLTCKLERATATSSSSAWTQLLRPDEVANAPTRSVSPIRSWPTRCARTISALGGTSRSGPTGSRIAGDIIDKGVLSAEGRQGVGDGANAP